MSNEEITALAREYAEEIFKNDESNPDLSICLLNDIKFEAAADFEEKLRFLLRRYCLVEKSKLIEEYKSAVSTVGKPNFCDTIRISEIEVAKKILLESLFPEITKEVENDA